eukprot:5787435-Alexandrium_andersonii.AAC.1
MSSWRAELARSWRAPGEPLGNSCTGSPGELPVGRPAGRPVGRRVLKRPPVWLPTLFMWPRVARGSTVSK